MYTSILNSSLWTSPTWWAEIVARFTDVWHHWSDFVLHSNVRPKQAHSITIAKSSSSATSQTPNSHNPASRNLSPPAGSTGDPDSEEQNREPAASYSRFSSDNQSDSGVTDQQYKCREHATAKQFVIPSEFEFADHAISGTKRDRPGLNRMLVAAKEGRFKVIFFFSLSQLGRETAITIPLLKELVHEHGIRVSEGFDSNQTNWEMVATITNVINEQYIKNLSSDVLRGLEGTLLAEYAVGDHRFGYRTVPSPNGLMTGRGRNAKPKMVYEIDEVNAAWVRKIFDWFVDERRPMAWIVKELNRFHAPKDHRSTTPDWDHLRVQ